LGSIFIGF